MGGRKARSKAPQAEGQQPVCTDLEVRRQYFQDWAPGEIFSSLSATLQYANKSHEELRFEHYRRVGRPECILNVPRNGATVASTAAIAWPLSGGTVWTGFSSCGVPWTAPRSGAFGQPVNAFPLFGGTVPGAFVPLFDAEGMLQSICTIPAHQDKCHEELRFEDYCRRGSPMPATAATPVFSSFVTPHPSPMFGHSPAPTFGHSPPPTFGHSPPSMFGHSPLPSFGHSPPPMFCHSPPPVFSHNPPPMFGNASSACPAAVDSGYTNPPPRGVFAPAQWDPASSAAANASPSQAAPNVQSLTGALEGLQVQSAQAPTLPIPQGAEGPSCGGHPDAGSESDAESLVSADSDAGDTRALRQQLADLLAEKTVLVVQKAQCETERAQEAVEKADLMAQIRTLQHDAGDAAGALHRLRHGAGEHAAETAALQAENAALKMQVVQAGRWQSEKADLLAENATLAARSQSLQEDAEEAAGALYRLRNENCQLETDLEELQEENAELKAQGARPTS